MTYDPQTISRRYIAAQTDTTYRPTGLRRTVQLTTPRGLAYAIGAGVAAAGLLTIAQVLV